MKAVILALLAATTATPLLAQDSNPATYLICLGADSANDVTYQIGTDPQGEWFTFENGTTRVGRDEGWTEPQRQGCFAWELTLHRLFDLNKQRAST